MVLNINVVILKIGGNLPTILQILFSIPLAKKMKVLCYFMACFSCRESEHASLHPDQSTLNEWARYNFNNIYSNHIPCTWGHSHWVMSYENKPFDPTHPNRTIDLTHSCWPSKSCLRAFWHISSKLSYPCVIDVVIVTTSPASPWHIIPFTHHPLCKMLPLD